jgi:copper(I)-binding protein
MSLAGRRAIALVVLLCSTAGVAAQRTVRASDAWVAAPAAGGVETMAFVTVDNGTMYDVYVVGAQSEAAEVVELRQTDAAGKASVVKEVPVPAFDRLEMSAKGVHLRLASLKKPLKPGETVTLTLLTDGGTALEVAAAVK